MMIKDRLLFLKYALPCARTLVKRKVVSQKDVDIAIKQVAENKVPEDYFESNFKVANAMCSAIAKRLGKDYIDSEVIRQYFLFEHNKVVDERFELMGDFNPEECKTRIGKVLEVNGNFATVETSLGEKKYKAVFAKNIKKNDNVVVHFDYIVEKVLK